MSVNVSTIHKNIASFSNSLQNRGRLMCIDWGTKRLGLAFSDKNMIVACACQTYLRTNIRCDIGFIKRMIQEREVVGLVIGWPLDLDGTEGEQCTVVYNFATKICQKTNLNIFLQDERHSSGEIAELSIFFKLSRRKYQPKDDSMAACLILQSSLDLFNKSQNQQAN